MIIPDNSLQDTNCEVGLNKMASFKCYYDTMEIIKDYNHNIQDGAKTAIKEKISSKSNKSKEECKPIAINQFDASTNSFKSENKSISCRICLEELSMMDLLSYNQLNMTNQLILPCLCKGTSGYCHQQCLKNWISVNFIDYTTASCEICKIAFCIIFMKGEILKEDKLRIIKNFLILFLFQIILNILIYLVQYKTDINVKVTQITSAVIFTSFNIVGFVSISFLMQKDFRFWRDGRVVDYTIANLQDL